MVPTSEKWELSGNLFPEKGIVASTAGLRVMHLNQMKVQRFYTCLRDLLIWAFQLCRPACDWSTSMFLSVLITGNVAGDQKNVSEQCRWHIFVLTTSRVCTWELQEIQSIFFINSWPEKTWSEYSDINWQNRKISKTQMFQNRPSANVTSCVAHPQSSVTFKLSREKKWCFLPT